MSAALKNAAEDRQRDGEAGRSTEILTFRLGSGIFAIEVRHVREVLDHKPIAPMPNAPMSLLGMIDVRGIGVPVVDLKRKLGLPGLDLGPTPDTRIIVLEFQSGTRVQTVAIVADAVHEVADIDDQTLEAPPQFGESWSTDFMRGLGRRGEEFMTLLEIEGLFNGREASPFDF